MKKNVLILLISIYSLSTSGIGIKQFYCCGKLKSTGISFVQDAKEKCARGKATGNCCKNKFNNLKVKDSHIAADGISSPVKHFTDLHLLTASFEVMGLANEPMSVAHASHAPPPHHGIPIYILHCVYRI